jgi:hypothetical protein
MSLQKVLYRIRRCILVNGLLKVYGSVLTFIIVSLCVYYPIKYVDRKCKRKTKKAVAVLLLAFGIVVYPIKAFYFEDSYFLNAAVSGLCLSCSFCSIKLFLNSGL